MIWVALLIAFSATVAWGQEPTATVAFRTRVSDETVTTLLQETGVRPLAATWFVKGFAGNGGPPGPEPAEVWVAALRHQNIIADWEARARNARSEFVDFTARHPLGPSDSDALQEGRDLLDHRQTALEALASLRRGDPVIFGLAVQGPADAIAKLHGRGWIITEGTSLEDLPPPPQAEDHGLEVGPIRRPANQAKGPTEIVEEMRQVVRQPEIRP